MDTLITFLLGIVSTASLAIALYFLRFWRRARDPLFLVFACAFALLALQWAASAFIQAGENAYIPFVIRLLAFSCIIGGIVHKNRSGVIAAKGAAR
jgi:hypothetical protein